MLSEGKASTSPTAGGASCSVSPPALEAPACSRLEGGNSVSPVADTKETEISEARQNWVKDTYHESRPARE